MLFTDLRNKFGNIDSLLYVLLDVYKITSWQDVRTRLAEYGPLSVNMLYSSTDLTYEECDAVVQYMFGNICIEYSDRKT